jgi:hypothetical protein
MLTNGPLTGKGYYLVERKFMDLHIFKEEPYTQREACLYLIENAAYQAVVREVDGMAIPLEIGQLVASYRYLAEAWGWGKSAKDRVKRYLEKLERHGWITLNTDYHVSRDSYKTVESKAYNKRPTLITVRDYRALQHKMEDSSSTSRDSTVEEFATDTRQYNDKPNQVKTNSNKKIKNQEVGERNQDSFLFDAFPQVTRSEAFIKYMPQHWQNYALHEKGWGINMIEIEAKRFWERYAGSNLVERDIRHSSFEKRKKWDCVWRKWCDQEFRNSYN